MTGSTWLDVAIVAGIVAIFAWWVVDKWRTVARARRVFAMTLDQVKAEAEQEAAAAARAAARRDGKPGRPWDRTTGPR